MIDKKNGHIFVHIPKTGGSSVSKAFEDCGYSDGWVRRRSHWKLAQYKNMFTDENVRRRDGLTRDYEDMFKWAIVRNPWDKLVSEYHFHKQSPNVKPKVHKFYKGLDFRSFIKIYKDEEHDKNVGWLGDRAHRRLQTFFIQPVYDLDYVARFENLQEGVDTVCDRIGVKRKKLPHIFKSKHKHYREYYDDELAEIVARRFQADISLFGYSF